MSDLNISYFGDGFDITLKPNGEPELTGGLTPAVILSMLVSPYWGNAVAETGEAYTSTLREIMRQPLRNKTRLEVIEAVKNALSWMIDAGIIEEITVEAEIRTSGRLDLLIKLDRPSGAVDYRYAINWDAQEVELL